MILLHKHARAIAPLLSVVLGLAGNGCNKSLSASDPQPTSAPVNKTKSARQVADPSVPLSDYFPLNGGIDLALLYHAVSREPADYEELARLGSPEYAGARDAFRRRELLPGLRQQFDASIAALAKRPYVYMQLNDVHLGNYDLDTHSFPVRGLRSERSHPYKFNDDSHFMLRFPNADNFQACRVDEQRAKVIQDLLTKYPLPTARVYGFAQKVDPGSTVIQTIVTGVGFYHIDHPCAVRGGQDCIQIIQF